jgi:hypothetical protein
MISFTLHIKRIRKSARVRCKGMYTQLLCENLNSRDCLRDWAWKEADSVERMRTGCVCLGPGIDMASSRERTVSEEVANALTT